MLLNVQKPIISARLLAIFLLIFLEQHCGQSEAANMLFRYMNFTDINVKFNTKYINNLTSWIEDGGVHFEMNTVRVITNGLRGNIEIQIKLENSKNYQTLFSYDIDVCKLLEHMKRSLLRNWFRLLLKKSNFKENCPVEIGNYYVRNMKLEGDGIPVYLQKGFYRINVHDYYGKRNTKNEDLVCYFLVGFRIY